jgi:hypothetical protein
MRSMMMEKAAMNVVRERDGDVTSLEYSVEHARYDEASSKRADRLDRKERYWGSLLSYLISYSRDVYPHDGQITHHFPTEHPAFRQSSSIGPVVRMMYCISARPPIWKKDIPELSRIGIQIMTGTTSAKAI